MKFTRHKVTYGWRYSFDDVAKKERHFGNIGVTIKEARENVHKLYKDKLGQNGKSKR